MYLRLIFLCVLYLASTVCSRSEDSQVISDKESTVASSDEAQLLALENRIKELSEREAGVRQKWMVGQRISMQKKRELMEKDEEVRALQKKINEQLEAVRALQDELTKLLDVRLARTAPEGESAEKAPSQEALQREILEGSKQRRELIREVDLLKRRMQSRGADSGETASQTGVE